MRPGLTAAVLGDGGVEEPGTTKDGGGKNAFSCSKKTLSGWAVHRYCLPVSVRCRMKCSSAALAARVKPSPT